MKDFVIALLQTLGIMLLIVAFSVGLAWLGRSAESPAPRQLLYVRWPTELANGWEVQWEYNGLYASSLHAAKEEALRLYAVLAGRMVEKE